VANPVANVIVEMTAVHGDLRKFWWLALIARRTKAQQAYETSVPAQWVEPRIELE
jgi:hypothetical protein